MSINLFALSWIKRKMENEANSDALVNSILDRSITALVSDKITGLGQYALAYNANLTTLKLKNLKTTSNFSITNCNNLSNVYMPNLNLLGYAACENNVGIKRLKIDVNTSLYARSLRNTSVETLILTCSDKISGLSDVNALAGTPIASGTGYIYVPAALIEEYKTATNWVTYADQFRAIEDYPDICGGV